MNVVGFLRWWRGELAAMMPRGLRRPFERRHDVLELELGDEEIALSRRANGHSEPLGRVAIDAPAARATMASLLGGMKAESTRVEVAVPSEKLLVKEVTLPLAAEENLRQVLGFEMERQTPFRADQVYYDYRVVARRPADQQLGVRLIVAPRTSVDPALTLLDGWDLEPAPADGAAGGEDDTRLAFIPGAFRQVTASRLNRVLALVNVALLAALVVIPLVQQHRELESLRAELDAARAAAARAVGMRERIDELHDQFRYLFGRKAAQPAAVLVLEELSRRLPDDTWLFRLEIKGGRVHLQGTSAAASALIAELDESRLFEDPRFLSPVTQDGATGRERFNLSAGVITPEAGAGNGTPRT